MNKKNVLIGIVVLAVLVFGYFMFMRNSSGTDESGSYGKINIDVVCMNALSYMSFPDGASADRFVAECKEGKYPQVIEDYKAQLNLDDGATI